MIDPWGLSYWLHATNLPDGSLQLTVYSFGANRRRNSYKGASDLGNHDDIGETGVLVTDMKQETDSAAPSVFSMDYDP